MPNGHRVSYRVAHGDSPSPSHTSDSDETFAQKSMWRRLAGRVIGRWITFVNARRRLLMWQALMNNRILPRRIARIPRVALGIAELAMKPVVLRRS